LIDNKFGLANSLSVSYLLNFPDLHIKIQAQIAFNCSDFSPNNQWQKYKEIQTGNRNEIYFSNQGSNLQNHQYLLLSIRIPLIEQANK